MRSVLIASALILALTVAGSTASADAPPAPSVMVIADSAFAAVADNQQPRALLTSGFDTTIDVGVCRRLRGASCPDGNTQVPTLVDVVHTLGPAIAPTVIVEVGYNDFVDDFPQSVEVAMTTLVEAGVKKILWVTMAEQRPQYIAMNEQVAVAAARHPEVALVDWAAASRGHDSYFQGDGVHLGYDGAMALAHLLRDALVAALVPPLVATPTRLPVAHLGKSYSAQLKAEGGMAPYRWRLASGSLTGGLHLLAGGRITGTPRRPGKVVLVLRATDAFAQTATLSATITVARR
jgi:lysophospholipase L1-like esterase